MIETTQNYDLTILSFRGKGLGGQLFKKGLLEVSDVSVGHVGHSSAAATFHILFVTSLPAAGRQRLPSHTTWAVCPPGDISSAIFPVELGIRESQASLLASCPSCVSGLPSTV